MNPFTGSTILWSILREYEPCNVLCWSCKGLLSESYGPKMSLNCMKYYILCFSNSTLSKLVWKLKGKNIEYTIKWSIERKAQSYQCGSRRCNLCLAEKVIIARSTNPCMINKRSELLNKCRHRNKFLLSSVAD